MDNWKNIRLELGRTEEFPNGSVSRGYLIRLPLSDCDTVDPMAFERHPYRATVRRYWSTEPDEAGLLYAVQGGLAMRCDGKPDRMLELDGRPLRLGQQISIAEANGTILDFRIASIR